MKIAGYIIMIFGLLALLGAMIGGRASAFGPLFWIALGIMLIYFGKSKEINLFFLELTNTNSFLLNVSSTANITAIILI